MKVQLKYGTEGLELEFSRTPNFRGILRPEDPPGLADPAAAVEAALAGPIASPPLLELARGRKDAVIVISDVTRPVPNAVLLPPIVGRLEQAGIPRERVTILIATGMHRPNEGAEMERLVGREIAASCRMVNHFSKRDAEMVLVGEIGDGIPALVNRLYIESDLKILTGFIEPHMWAGFSGGRKAILPGISSIRTLEFMHGPEMVAHPGTRYGVLEGNPFHEAALDVMEKAGADFIVNVTLNTRKEVTGVFAGHPVTAHLEGVADLSRHCVQTLEAPLDFIVTTNAGAPLDCNLYQTAKGLSGVAGAVREGGAILIATECLEGFGSDEYRAVFEYAVTPAEFIRKLMQKEFFLPDQWCAQETYQVMLKNEIWIYTRGIDAETLRRFHFRPVESVGGAVEALLQRFGREAAWAIAPEGPLLILQLAEGA